MTKAYLREDLIQSGSYPPILIGGSFTHLPFKWSHMWFECFQPNEWEDREWNTILIHPQFGIFLAKSIDWDFKE